MKEAMIPESAAGTTVRVAALLHLAHYGAAGLARPITEPTFARAVALARWAIPHALAAHGAMGQDDPFGGAEEHDVVIAGDRATP